MDVNAVLLDILVVLLAAKVAAEMCERVNIPAVVGEIAIGVVIGPSVFGFVEPGSVLQTLAELGVILLLLEVGLEMDLRDLGAVGRASLSVAMLGVVVPLIGGLGAGLALGMDGKEALFVGAALTATSVGITARVFGDLRALASVEARTVLGAAVADDIMGLVILTVVTRVVTEGSVSPLGLAWVILVAIGFVVVATALGVRFAPPAFAWIRRYSRSSGTLLVLALVFTLAVAELAHAAQLAPIVGAFVAGLALARSNVAERVRTEIAPIGHVLIPIFFVQIGIDVEVGEFAKVSVLVLAAVLLVVAVLGKLASAAGLFGAPGDRFLIGIGMIPRGEVGLIFATLGLREHVFGQKVYAALLLVVLATTIGTPPLLRARLLALRGRRRAPVSGVIDGGPLVAIDDAGRVTLTGEPLPSDALAVALAAAREVERHPPTDELLEWFDFFPAGPRRWDDRARDEFWRLLREGGSRSWQLLINAGVLQRALPELDDAIAARPRDGLQIDPLASLSFARLAAVREEIPTDDDAIVRPLLLAALVLDASEDSGAEPVVVARRTVQRLDLGARVEQMVAGLVSDAGLLGAASRHVDAFDEERVVQLAVHLGSPDQARALWLLTCSTFDGALWERERLDQLHDLIQTVLAHPELTGRDAIYEVDRRKAAARALTADAAVRARIDAAPREYVTTVAPDELVRHALRCEPPPRRDDVLVFVDLLGATARVDMVARDRVGLVAHMTAVLAECGCSVVDALVVTWPDSVAFSSYRMTCDLVPNADRLRVAMESAMHVPLSVPSTPEATLRFDDDASPWHTRCFIETIDQPGLLASLTGAFAVADVNVDSARITTEGSSVVDTFELTDRRGGKLDDAAKERIRAALVSGVQRRSTPWLKRLRAALT